MHSGGHDADERRLNASVSMEKAVTITPEAAAGRRALAGGRVGVGGKRRIGATERQKGMLSWSSTLKLLNIDITINKN
jgi:hypothetical protein